MILDMGRIFLMLMGAIFCALVAFLVLVKAWDWWRAWLWTRKRAKKAAKTPEAVYLHFTFEDRLAAPTEAERTILDARAKVRRDLDRQMEQEQENWRVWKEIEDLTA